MEFRILGALEVRHEGSEIPISGVKQRRALTLLLWEAGRTVSVDRLIEALWDGEPPITARRQVQNIVAALRRAMAAEDPIERSGDGYRLQTEATDWARFRTEVAEARTAAAAGRFAEACDLLKCALSRWQGCTSAAIEGDQFSTMALSMNEERLRACEDLFEAQLVLGLHREALIEIRTLVSEHPERQRLHALLMLALYRSGDAAAALRTYTGLAERLADELGIEPDRRLRDLYVAILREDPGLDLETPAAAVPVVPRPEPAARGAGAADAIDERSDPAQDAADATALQGRHPAESVVNRSTYHLFRLVSLALVVSMIGLVAAGDGLLQTPPGLDAVAQGLTTGRPGEPLWTYPADAEGSVMMVEAGLLVLGRTELRLEAEGEVVWSVPVDGQQNPKVALVGDTVVLSSHRAGDQPWSTGSMTLIDVRSGKEMWGGWSHASPVAVTEDAVIVIECSQAPNGGTGECVLESVQPPSRTLKWRVFLDHPTFPLASDEPYESPWGQPLASDYVLVRSYSTGTVDRLTAYDAHTGTRLSEFDFYGIEDAQLNGDVLVLHEESNFTAEGHCEAHIRAYYVRSAAFLWERHIDTPGDGEGRCQPLPALKGGQDLLPVTLMQSASVVWRHNGELQWTVPAPSSAQLLIGDSLVTAEEQSDRITVWNVWSHRERWSTQGKVIGAQGSTLWVVDRTAVDSRCGGLVGYDLASGESLCLPGSLEYLTEDVVVTVHNSTWQAWPADPWS